VSPVSKTAGAHGHDFVVVASRLPVDRAEGPDGQAAAPGATIWMHDYQLQLVPRLVREQRADVRIGFFNHIPFPGYDIFAQLPWRRQVIEGLLGADLLGFQRRAGAANFLQACRRAVGLRASGHSIEVSDPAGPRVVLVQVASPSRERVEAYRALRDEHAKVGNPPVH
jgi:trehalose 6-phosphate synthase